jgi:FSR family fosmidomycin resistance protein-like MFS transporter
MTSRLHSRLLLTGSSLSLLLVIAHATNDAFTSMLAALLPTLQVRFGASETMLALFVATLSFSSSVTQPVFGAIADRVGRRAVGALGVLTSSVVLSLMGVASSPWLLLLLLLFGGLGSAAFHPAGTSIARSAAGSKKGLALGIFSAGGTAGLAVGPLLIGLFIINGWLAWSPWLMLPGLIMGVLMFVLVPQQPTAAAHERPRLFDMELFRGPVGQLCLAGTLRSVSWVAFINSAPLWLVHVRGVSADSPVIFWTLAAFSLAGGLGGILAGMLERRVSRQILVTGTMLLGLVPLFLLFVVPTGSLPYFILIALAGALINGGLPLMVVSAQDLAPHAVGTASGMLMGLTWGTAGVLYLGVGALQELIGINGAMAASFLTLVPGALVAWRVLNRNRAALG